MSAGGPELPIDLVEDILMRLQLAKDVLRCKAVSKGWYDLITSRRFIETRRLLHESRKSMFIATTRRNDMVSFSQDGLKYPLYLPPTVKAVKASSNSNRRLGLVGSCNGLLCLIEDKLVHVWNPTTRECKEPIMLLDEASAADVYAIGFGYDAITDDYKVVKINKTTCYAEVWSMSTHAWRKVDSVVLPDEYWITCRSGLFVGRNLYWLAKKYRRGQPNNDYMVVISFDMGDETSDSIAMSGIAQDYTIRYRPTLIDYMGSLALLICIRGKRRRQTMRRDYRFAIWILNDSSNSWTQPLSIGPIQIRFTVLADLCMKEKLVIRTGGKYFLRDADERENTELQGNPSADIPEWHYFLYDRLHWSFVESLVSVK